MNMCPSYKRKVPPELCLKGQVFFIWSNQQSLQFAQYQISLLGGRIDNFLSKEITTILIEDTQLIAAQYYPADLAVRQAYAQNGIATESYNHPSIVYNLPSTSRGYSLLASSPGVNSPLRVITFARQWGIQVLGIAYFLSCIDPIVKSIAHLIHQPKKSQNVSNLTGCFIKFECFHKKFRPCYKMFNSDPERLMPLRNANILVKPEACNVILEKPAAPKQLPFNHMDPNDKALFQTHEAKPPMKANDKKYPNKLKPKEENNYCECCRTHFSDLKLHIKSANHLKFVSNEKNYETVNNILKMLPSAQEFIQKHQKPAQTSEVIVQNGEVVNSDSATAVDFSMPLNLHVKKVESPVIHFPEGSFENHLPLNLHVKKHDEISIPLDLHVKPNDVKVETPQPLPIVEPPTMVFANEDITPSVCKSEIDVVGLKTDSPQDSNLLEPKIDAKDFCIPEVADVLPDDPLPAVDPVLDKANPTQLYLKNFDSYWLDSLPCEMDDIIFDDNIFDFDDGKQKFTAIEQAECAQPAEAFPISDMPQSPCLVSGISTDVKMRSAANTSLMNSPIDIKDVVVKHELVNAPEPYSPVCKTEQEFKNCHSPVVSEKKEFSGSFDVKSNTNQFYDDKHNMDISPSCPNAMAMKSSEQMFSSDSSDDENGNVFISNVLNIITTNSDSEMKVDRESCEEDSVSNSKSITRHKSTQPRTSSTKLVTTDVPQMSPVLNDSDISQMSPAIDSSATFKDNSEMACTKNEDPTFSGKRNTIPNHNAHESCSSRSVPICAESEPSCASTLAASCSSITPEAYAGSKSYDNNADQTCTVTNVIFPGITTGTAERFIAPDRTYVSNPEPVQVNTANETYKNSTVYNSVKSELINSKTVKSHKSGKEISMTKNTSRVASKEKSCGGIRPASAASQSPLELPKRQKILHKKSVRKLRKLPSLWSVSILPGKGVKLKFTCVQPESFVAVESDEEGVASSVRPECQ